MFKNFFTFHPFNKVNYMLILGLGLSYILFSFICVLNATSPYNTIFSQTQNLLAIIISLSFTFVGFLFTVVLTLLEVAHYIATYPSIDNSLLLIHLSSRLITLIACFFISLTQTRQLYYKKQQERLLYTDDLTGLYNHRFFLKQLSLEVQKSIQNHSQVGLILLDIDNLKLVNDNIGQDVGTTIILSTAKLLQHIISAPCTTYRYFSDTFAVIVPFDSLPELDKLASDLKAQLDALKSKYIPIPLTCYVSFSLGYSSLPHLAQEESGLIKQAEAALNHSKNAGKDAIHIYEDILENFKHDMSKENRHLIGIFKALLTSISMKDQYTLGHCERVASYAAKLATHLQLNPDQISSIHYAGLLHDIGKIEIPSTILNKTTPLSDDEYALIKKHPIYSFNILEPLLGMEESIDYVRHHHERYDGKGYPDGLSGEAISLGARILAVVDSFDAMISERPYSKSKSVTEALHELKNCAALQFDPYIVDSFVNLMTQSNTANHV